MVAMASLEVAITANTAPVEQGFARTTALLEQFQRSSGAADMSFGKLTGSFVAGTVIANAFMGAIGGITGAVQNAAGATLGLASRLEQARIGFTTMLGSVQQADQFIGKLQQKAESTAFSFPGLQQVAQSFMAMGMSAAQVLPVIDDVSNALAAAGKGGDMDALQRVGQSLSEVAAQGKITAEQIRELSRNGIAVLPLLSEAFGVTAGEVRKMAESGEISAEKFFAAFHSGVALHYGDIQAQQARTWAVAASNVEDIVGRLATQTFKELTDAATAGALALNDFLHSDRVTAWAADVKQAIHEVMAALAPLGAAFQAVLGLSGQPTTSAAAPAKPIAPVPDIAAQSRDSWSQAGKSVDDYKGKVAEAALKIHEITAVMNGLSAQKLILTWQIQDIKADYAAKIQGLKDEQEGWNVKIQQTKDYYTGLLEPLNRMQSQLSRLGEDTKKVFAGILDPLKASLQTTTRQIDDAKSGYEAMTRPIQAQITAIERVNQALHRQLSTQNEIADLALRTKILNAEGDPAARGDIAAKLLLNQYAQQDLDNKRQLAELQSKKGLSDKAAAEFDKQGNVLEAERIRLQQQGLSLIDRSAMAEAERQKIINDAARERNAITLGNADLAAASQVDPMKEKLRQAQDALKAFTDPLILQQQALTRAIQDVGNVETATMKPIIDAQAELARKIQDTNQAQQDALAPMEAKQQSIAKSIAGMEAAERTALAPLLEREQSLQRQLDQQEAEKKKWEEIKTAASDALKDIKIQAEDTAKSTAKVAGGAATAPAVASEPGEYLPIPRIPESIIPAGMIADFHELAVNVQGSADAFNNLNAATNGGVVGTIGELGRAIGLIAANSVAISVVTRLGPAIAGLATPAGAALVLLVGLEEFVLHLPQIQDAMGKFWDQFDTRNDEERAADKEAWDTHYAERKVAFDGFWGGLGTGIANWLREAKTTQDAQLTIIGDAWNTYWDTTFPTQLKTFWEVTLPAVVKGGFETALGLMPGSVDKMLHAFDPLVNLFNWIADHWPGKNQPAITLPGVPGGGNLQTSYNPGQSGLQGIYGDAGPITAEALSIMRTGQSESIEQYIRQSASLRGIDANIAVLVAKSEGGLLDPTRQSDVVYQGQREQSYGPFQLNINGGLGATAMAQGIDPRNEAQWKQAVDFALDQVSKGGWEPFHGAAASGIGNWQGVGSPGAAAGATVMASLSAPGPATRTQFQLVDQGLTADAAAAFCGPYAAMLFANAVGRYPTATEAQQLAAKVGWTSGAGMAGIQSELALMQSMGLNVVQQMGTPSNINAALGAGHPITLSTPGHYFEATGGTAEGGLNVGATGTALKGGKAVMTLAEIEALSGPLQGIIVLQDNLTTAQNAGAQAAAVQATALARLGQIQSGGVASTNALGAAQRQTVTWAQQMADQEAALNATLAQQVPPGRAAADAMKQLGSVLGPVERQVAAGAISADTLRGTLLDLAKSTGLADKPWMDFATGAMDANAAMDELIQTTAVLGPEFQAVADYQKTAGSSSNEAALRWLLAAQHYAEAKEVLAKAPDVPAVAGAGAAGGKSPVDVQAQSFDALKPKIDASTESLRNYQTIVQGFDTKTIAAQTEAWNTGTDAINTFSDAAHQIGDYLDKHEFHFKATFDDVPSDYKPGSPSPLENALRGIISAGTDLNSMRVHPILDTPGLARASVGSGGGGNTIVVNGLTVTSQATTTRDMAEDIRSHLIQIGRENGGPDRIFG